jgi:hypothetical protein
VKREILVAGVCAIAGAVLALQLRPAPPPAPSVVHTDTLFLEAQRPKLEHPSLGQRLTTTRVRGRTAIADAPSAPAQLAVRRYCAPMVEDGAIAGAIVADSAANVQHIAVLPDFGGRRAGPRLELYSTLNNARRWQWTGTVRGRVQWQSSGDSVLVTGDRIWARLVRGAPKCAAKMAVHGLVGGLLDDENRLEGAAIAAGVRALDCLF